MYCTLYRIFVYCTVQCTEYLCTVHCTEYLCAAQCTEFLCTAQCTKYCTAQCTKYLFTVQKEALMRYRSSLVYSNYLANNSTLASRLGDPCAPQGSLIRYL